MVPYLAAIVFATTVFFLVLAFAGGEPRLRSRLESLRRGGGGMPQPDGDGQLTMVQRLVMPATDAPVQALRNFLPATMLENMRQRLLVAGEPMTVNAYLTLRLLSLVTFILLPLLFIMAGVLALGPVTLLLLAAFVFAGFLLPQLWLQQRVSQRQNTIIKSLPDSFDLITTCVEAGLGLDAALARVADKVEGPFAAELSRTLRDISLGKMRRDALRELGERTGVPDLITFVNAVVQAEQMGSSIGPVLRVQSEQLRVRRRQRAEAQAYKAPVKMIFPLVLCIFPTLFIVILGPAVITIIQDFPGR
jgi:tight adherence protein C